MSKKSKKKDRKNLTVKLALATTIINLIIAIIELLGKLIE